MNAKGSLDCSILNHVLAVMPHDYSPIQLIYLENRHAT
jgi:hypothetical protein